MGPYFVRNRAKERHGEFRFPRQSRVIKSAMRILAHCFAILICLMSASAVLAEQPPRIFSIGAAVFSEADIIDARALPELGGTTSIMLTLSKDAGDRLAALTRTTLDTAIPVMLDGVELAQPVVREEIKGGVLVITGTFTLEEAATLAKKISGKDPLPTDLEE